MSKKSRKHKASRGNEKPLHAALKAWYAQPNDQLEASVDGFFIDILRGDLLIEIQTRSFSAIKKKLAQLIQHHRLRLVHPIAHEKWIIRLTDSGRQQLDRRKSPKRGRFEHVFVELVSFPQLMVEPNFSLEVLLIQEEEVRQRSGRHRAWRRKGWITQERRLLRVTDRRLFETPTDFADMLPSDLAEPFTTADLATAAGLPRRLAQRMAYCLREMGLITAVAKQGRAILYTRSKP